MLNFKLRPVAFSRVAMVRLKRKLKKAPTTGKLAEANEKLGDDFLFYGQRMKAWELRIKLMDENECCEEFCMELPDVATRQQMRMLRTIVVCTVLNGEVRSFGKLYDLVRMCRHQIEKSYFEKELQSVLK